MNSTENLDHAIDVLASYSGELEAIYRLGTERPLSATSKRAAQERLAALKARFKADVRTYRDREQRGEDDVAIHTLLATLQEASARIHVGSNANPETNREWSGDLYSARVDVDYYLDQLRTMRAKHA